jgi:TPP-dependent pyruvate/acetoin dehydrogenase alpha subunit
LLALGTNERDLVEIEQAVVERVLAASEIAINAEFPDSETAFTDLWSDGTSDWKKATIK